MTDLPPIRTIPQSIARTEAPAINKSEEPNENSTRFDMGISLSNGAKLSKPYVHDRKQLRGSLSITDLYQ